LRFRKERASTPVIITGVGSKPEAGRTEHASTPLAGLTVADIMQRWPETIAVFMAYRMACVGCYLAPFDTVADVARNYQLDPDELLHALQKGIDATRDASETEA
jgi:hybrid cluster-associated redox disulfide protein